MKKNILTFLVGSVGLWTTIVATEASAALTGCADKTGSCQISNDPDDQLFCDCIDGGGGGVVGGNDWAGLDATQLEVICEEQLGQFCAGAVPPPPGILCENEFGICEVNNMPDSVSCECVAGGFGGDDGGNDWDGLSDAELLAECELALANQCEAVDPTGGGTTDGGTTDGGTTDGGTTDGGTTDGGTTDGGDDEGGNRDTGAATDTGADGGQTDTGAGNPDDGGEAGNTDGAQPGTSGGQVGTSGVQTGGGGEGAGGATNSGSGCSVGGQPALGGLFVLGLLGLTRRRRVVARRGAGRR